jgi:hypothetical protein
MRSKLHPVFSLFSIAANMHSQSQRDNTAIRAQIELTFCSTSTPLSGDEFAQPLIRHFH